jgi:hypothetical protein
LVGKGGGRCRAAANRTRRPSRPRAGGRAAPCLAADTGTSYWSEPLAEWGQPVGEPRLGAPSQQEGEGGAEGGLGPTGRRLLEPTLRPCIRRAGKREGDRCLPPWPSRWAEGAWTGRRCDGEDDFAQVDRAVVGDLEGDVVAWGDAEGAAHFLCEGDAVVVVHKAGGGCLGSARHEGQRLPRAYGESGQRLWGPSVASGGKPEGQTPPYWPSGWRKWLAEWASPVGEPRLGAPSQQEGEPYPKAPRPPLENSTGAGPTEASVMRQRRRRGRKARSQNSSRVWKGAGQGLHRKPRLAVNHAVAVGT